MINWLAILSTVTIFTDISALRMGLSIIFTAVFGCIGVFVGILAFFFARRLLSGRTMEPIDIVNVT
jgi:VIT1/CCC1 family predicted Fe2+/Mn2+ transporter